MIPSKQAEVSPTRQKELEQLLNRLKGTDPGLLGTDFDIDDDLRTPGGRFRHTVAVGTEAERLMGKVCSGVRVGKYGVLTAAHCAYSMSRSNDQYYAYFGSDLDYPFKVSFRKKDGVAIINWFNTDFVQRYVPGQPFSQEMYGTDLALIYLEHTGELDRFGDWIAEIAPKSAYDEFISLSLPEPIVYVAGYGATDPGATSYPRQRRVGRIEVQDPYCSASSCCTHGAEAIIADPCGVRDSCNGDSGGGVYAQWHGKDQLVAIVSRAWSPTSCVQSSRCGPGGVYTLLISPTVHQWVMSNKDLN